MNKRESRDQMLGAGCVRIEGRVWDLTATATAAATATTRHTSTSLPAGEAGSV